LVIGPLELLFGPARACIYFIYKNLIAQIGFRADADQLRFAGPWTNEKPRPIIPRLTHCVPALCEYVDWKRPGW
jgi:hypothetical protein